MKRFSRRKFLIVASGTMMWLGLIVGGTFAALSDAATLTGNSLSVGSANLMISNSQNGSSTIYEKTREGFALNLVPGQKTEKYFLLKNTSSGEIPLTIALGAVITQEDPLLEKFVKIEVAPVDSEGRIIPGTGLKGNTLQNLKAGQLQLDGLIARGAYQRYLMVVTVDPGFSAADRTIGYDLIFTGTQHIL